MYQTFDEKATNCYGGGAAEAAGGGGPGGGPPEKGAGRRPKGGSPRADPGGKAFPPCCYGRVARLERRSAAGTGFPKK